MILKKKKENNNKLLNIYKKKILQQSLKFIKSRFLKRNIKYKGIINLYKTKNKHNCLKDELIFYLRKDEI